MELHASWGRMLVSTVLGVVIGMGVATPAGAAVGDITNFSTGISANAQVNGIAAGADGNVWFTEYGTSKIARITPGGAVTEFPVGPYATYPQMIAAGGDGNMWFTTGLAQVGRVTPSGTVTLFSRSSVSVGPWITAGPDGNMWFVSGSGLARITPSGAITAFDADLPQGTDVEGLATGADGNLWFTVNGNDDAPGDKIERMTPGGTVTEFSAGISGKPLHIALGADGNLWFTEYRQPGSTSAVGMVGRITPAGVVTEFPVSATRYPGRIAAGRDGNLWFTEVTDSGDPASSDSIGRITLGGRVTHYTAGVAAGAFPLAIASGPDGNLWFTETSANKIGRIVPGAAPNVAVTMAAHATDAKDRTFAVTSGAGHTRYWCALDQGSEFPTDYPTLAGLYPDCGASGTTIATPLTLTNLSEGAHTLRVATGTTSLSDPFFEVQYASVVFTVDSAPPETTLDTLVPAGDTMTTTADFTFSATDPAPSSGAPTFECSLDTAPFTACVSGKHLSGLADGAHTFRVRAKDGAGNVDTTPAQLTWKVDTAPPTAPGIVSPTPDQAGVSPLPTLNWGTASDTVTGVASYRTFIDGNLTPDGVVAAGSCVAGRCSWKPTVPLTGGVHVIRVQAVDGVGNAGPKSSVTFSVDAEPPATFSLLAPAASAVVTSAMPRLSWGGSQDAGSGLARYAVWIDGVHVGDVSPDGPLQFDPVSTLADGAHTWQVLAIDSAGNERASATRTFTVDTSEPPTSLDGGPIGVTVAVVASFSFSSPGTPGVTFQCQLDGGAWASCTSPTSYPGLQEGQHGFRVRAVSQLGTTDQTPSERVWTVDTTTTPSAQLTASPNPAMTDQQVAFDATGSVDHADGRIISYAWDLEGDGSFVADPGASGKTSHSYTKPGTYDAAVRVTNDSGRTAVQTQRVEVRPAPPSGELGITVNDGAQFTNDADVTISAVWPGLATRILVSNDGGFGAPLSAPVTPTIAWKLKSSGPERLPKTVYVRFSGGQAGRETYQDDIILDETPPVVSAVTSSGGTVSRTIRAVPALPARVAKTTTRAYKLKIKASDKTSGVAGMQITSDKRKPGKLLRYSTKATFKTTKTSVYVRAKDRAGNFSTWRTARR